MPAENPQPAKLGREVVISQSVLPGFEGRVIMFHTKWDENADPIHPDLERTLIDNASSSAMREILQTNIDEARGITRGNT